MKIDKKILTASVIIVLSYFYILFFSPFFGIADFIIVLVPIFLLFYLSSKEQKAKITDFFERHAKIFLLLVVLISVLALNSGGLFSSGPII